MTKMVLGTPFRVAGMARSPDREGALAHIDLGRGFALTARGSMGPADVVDPTIWVKEKISVALGRVEDPDNPPLRRVIGALRALHAELMARPEADRPWVAVLVLLLLGEDAVAISAGDCPCMRFRSGLLAKLGRTEADLGPRPPRGALGSEPQVRIEVVPLRPQAGDLYVLSTRPLREGEVAVLARDLAGARDTGQLLLAGVEGAHDRGRVAVRVLEPFETDAAVEAIPEPRGDEPEETAAPTDEIVREDLGDWGGSLEIEPLGPGDYGSAAARLPRTVERDPGEVSTSNGTATHDPIEVPPTDQDDRPIDVPPEATIPGAAAVESNLESGETPPSETHTDTSPAMEAFEDRSGTEAREVPDRPLDHRREPTLAPVGEERPWYEPLILWAGGGLAIVSLALLIRALLPGFMGPTTGRTTPPPAAPTASGTVDLFSDPAGATVRLDGVPLEGKTPLTGVTIDAGLHRVELDWGPFGVWRDTVEVSAGSRLTLHPALFGSVSFRSSEPGRVLDVYLDGVYVGATPLSLDRVVIGRHLVRFGGPGLTTSAQEVVVNRDAAVELVGNAGPVPPHGALTVRSALLGDAGFESARGDPCWVDGTPRGVTPATLDLPPGTHSVRVARRGFPPQVTVLDVKAGGEHFVTAEFGARSEEPLRYDAPPSLSRADASPLTVALPESEVDPEIAVWLYAAPPGGTFQPKRMTRLDESSRTFAALIPQEVLRTSARQVRLYFRATGAAGREIYSEIYTVPLRD